MTERSIIMQADSVRAILDGRKTQTRRVIRPQPTAMDDERRRLSVLSDCPYGKPGDLLYMKEGWRMALINGVSGDGEFATVQFKEIGRAHV